MTKTNALPTFTLYTSIARQLTTREKNVIYRAICNTDGRKFSWIQDRPKS